MTRRGSILIVTMWILLALVAIALVMARQVRMEANAAATRIAQAQCQAALEGVGDWLLTLVDQEISQPGSTADILMEARAVGDCQVWVLKPNLEEDEAPQFGLIDEAGKLDLNTASPAMLLKLPGMSEELVDALIDWRDGDKQPRPQGAEESYYMGLQQPYVAKNGPLESLEELRLVKGFTRGVIWGMDRNRNGQIETREERGGTQLASLINGTPLGIAPLVTVYGLNATTQTATRTDLNRGSQSQMETQLRTFIPAARALTLAQSAVKSRPFTSLFEAYFTLAIRRSEAQSFLTRFQTSSQTAGRVAKVNLLTAPRQVIACLPLLEDQDGRTIRDFCKDRAGTTPPAQMASLAWLIDLLPRNKLIAIGPWVTGASRCYSADVVAVSSHGKTFRRMRLIFDASGGKARLRARYDLTQSGFPLSREMRQVLRTEEETMNREVPR